MVSGKYSAVAGAISREQAIANISNNLANVSTTGYKKSTMAFESLLRGEKQVSQSRGINYTRVSQNGSDFSSGPVKPTGNPLDVAINGNGFFKIMGPNGVMYTRRGDFVITPDDVLRTRTGMPVLNDVNGEIVVPDSQNGQIEIDSSGNISISTVEGTANAGTLAIVDIENTDDLKRSSDTSFVLEPQGQEIPVAEPSLISGSVESSNVNVVEEMSKMMGSYRTFEAFFKVLERYGDISDKQAELGTIR